MSATDELLAEAEACYEQGELEESLQRYLRVLDERPDDAEVLNDIGTVCFAAGLLQESRGYYLRALSIDRGHEAARTNLRALCRAQGVSWQRVLAELAAEPASPPPGEGTTPGSAGDLQRLFEQGDYDRAYELAVLWTRTEPSNPEAWNDAAVIADELGKTAEAVGYIQQAASLAPDDPEIQANAREILSTPDTPAARTAAAPTRVLFLEHGTRAMFLRNLIRALEGQDGLEMRRVEVCSADVTLPIDWADVIWLEWASPVAAYATRKLQQLRRKKVILRLHRFEAYGEVPYAIDWDVVDCLVLVSEHMREVFRRRFPHVSSPMRVIYNGVDLDRFTVPEDREKATDVAFLAHLDYRKNLPLMFQVARAMKDAGSPRRICVGGDWRSPEVREYFDHMREEMELRDRVVHEGYIEDVPSWLADKRVLLSCSINEGHPYNILEGMAAGLRPVIHNFPGAREMFPEECVFETVDQAAHLLVGPDGSPATYREFVRDRYPRSRQVEETCALIEELMEAEPAGEEPSAEPGGSVAATGEQAKGLSRTYSEKWYRDRLMYRPAYHQFARAIEEAFAPESLVDLGCGAGYLIEYFAGNIPVLGVEGSEAAFRVMSGKAREHAVMGDLTGPPSDRLSEFEFAVSIEVAEHIPEQHARDFVRWLQQADRVLLTAAPPGQGGNDHVNEQPPEYWHGLLAESGLRYCPEGTARWRALARAGTGECRWVVQNAMFFRRD